MLHKSYLYKRSNTGRRTKLESQQTTYDLLYVLTQLKTIHEQTDWRYAIQQYLHDAKIYNHSQLEAYK